MTSDIEIELNDTQLRYRLSIKLIFLSYEIRRVSSVLNKDNKNYGKKNLIDGSEETCWNSEAVRFFNFLTLI